MLRTRIAVVAASVALLVAAAVFVAAQEMHGGGPHVRRAGEPGPPPPPPMPFGVPEIEHLSRALNLTDAQASELKTFFEGRRPTFEAIHQRLEETHRQLEQATADGRFDETQVRVLANQQGQAHADMIVEHERCKAKVYSVLTPEQRARLEELHRHHGPHHRGPGAPHSDEQ